jgi:hypothetical protein
MRQHSSDIKSGLEVVVSFHVESKTTTILLTTTSSSQRLGEAAASTIG